MRASIEDIIAKGEETTLSGKIPVDTSKSYQSELLSYSNGKGIFITEPYGYDIYNDKPIINDIGNDNNDSNKEGLRYLFQKQDENWGLNIKFKIESRNHSFKIVDEGAYLYQLENLNGSTLLKKWNWCFFTSEW